MAHSKDDLHPARVARAAFFAGWLKRRMLELEDTLSQSGEVSEATLRDAVERVELFWKLDKGHSVDTETILVLLNLIEWSATCSHPTDGLFRTLPILYGVPALPPDAELPDELLARPALNFFEHHYPDYAGRVTDAEFAAVVRLWSRRRGNRREAGISKWEAAFNLAKKMGLEPQSAAALETHWKRSGNERDHKATR